jgi:glycosyltransferase involved in cell wall biosynthesis
MDKNLTVPLTVLLPVYNGGQYLKQAIQSILDQSYLHFEFLIINDGSNDESEQIINCFTDKRIRLINNPSNIGLVNTLNKGLQLSKGVFIARMDADDISCKFRLQKQLEFMTNNTEIDIIGCHIALINQDNEIIGNRFYSVNHDLIKMDSLFHCPLPHPGIMLRKNSFLERNLFYNANYRYYAEDYELWRRALTTLRFANYDEILLQYRITNQQASSIHATNQKKESHSIRVEYLKDLGLADDKDIQTLILDFLDNQLVVKGKVQFEMLLKISCALAITNTQRKIFNETIFTQMLAKKLDRMVKIYTSKKNNLYSLYKRNYLFQFSEFTLIDKIKVSLKEWLI